MPHPAHRPHPSVVTRSGVGTSPSHAGSPRSSGTAASLDGTGVQAHTSAPSSRRLSTVVAATRIAASPDRVFAFHADVRNLPRITPGPLRIVHAPVPTHQGDQQLIEVGPPGLRRRMFARITVYDPPRRIVDRQERGPFRAWQHSHNVRPDGDGSILIDRVRFALLPVPWLDRLLVAPVLRLLFAERHRRTRRLLARTP